MILQDLSIGTTIVDVDTTFFSEPILWLVIDKDHQGYPANTVTLISKYILRLISADGCEPSSPHESHRNYGNPNYAVSNIRQWLNSGDAAWYSPQHPYDAPPTQANVCAGYNPSDTAPGFLRGFSRGFAQALLPTPLVYVNPPFDGGHTQTLTDRVFLLSSTENGLGNANGANVEGTPISYFSTTANRRAYPTQACADHNGFVDLSVKTTSYFRYWLRSYINATIDIMLGHVSQLGTLSSQDAYYTGMGFRPACNLPADVPVSSAPEPDGAYVLQFPPVPAVWTRQNGEWRNARNLFVRQEGSWRQTRQIHVKHSTWHT